MTTCSHHNLNHPSNSSSPPSPKHQGMQTHSSSPCEHRGVTSIHPVAPNFGQPKGYIQPTAGKLPRRVRGAPVPPQPIIELVSKHPNLNLDEFRSGAGFFVPAKRSQRRIPVRSCTLRESRGVILFIQFAPPNFGGQPQGHLKPTVGNLPRRRKASVIPQVQTDTVNTPTAP